MSQAPITLATAEPAPLTLFAELTPERRARAESALAALDISDGSSVLTFGSGAQEKLTQVSDAMLEGVRVKDTGPAGQALANMLSVLRGFAPESLQPGQEPGFFRRILGAVPDAQRILAEYQQVKGRVEEATDELESHKTKLMRDIVSLDGLYAETLAYFHDLADWIAAGEEALRRADAETIPAAEARAAAGEMIDVQKLRDLRAARDALERRVHDLKLTRQVAMQALPSIRLVQENDRSLVGKITSVLANTVPLWRQQLAQAVTIHRSVEAGRAVKAATDLTNELLAANAKNLRTANAQVRTEMERGIVDIAVLKQANQELIATIEDSLRIADEGKAKRRDAERELAEAEAALKRTLSAARATATAPAAAQNR
jgi:uncharacterized protein YaaN involved in tellurite resistance